MFAIIGMLLFSLNAHAGENLFSFAIDGEGRVTVLSDAPPSPPPPGTAPTYNGYYFLGATAREVYDGSGTNDVPLNAAAERATRYCRFMGRNSASFVQVGPVPGTPVNLASVHPSSNLTVVVQRYDAYGSSIPTLLRAVDCR